MLETSMGTVGDYSVRVRSRFCIPAMPTAWPERACSPVGYSLRGIVFSGLSLPAVSCRVLLKTALCTILGENERAIHLERPLERIHRESTASKTDTPLFISLALHPAKPSINAGFCSYLLTYEEIGTTSNPSCSARRVTTISVVITYLTQVNLLRQDGVAVAVFPFQVFQRLTNRGEHLKPPKSLKAA